MLKLPPIIAIIPIMPLPNALLFFLHHGLAIPIHYPPLHSANYPMLRDCPPMLVLMILYYYYYYHYYPKSIQHHYYYLNLI